MSFSVVYKIGRSLQTLDIACFDKQQFEVWMSGLQVFDCADICDMVDSVLASQWLTYWILDHMVEAQ